MAILDLKRTKILYQFISIWRTYIFGNYALKIRQIRSIVLVYVYIYWTSIGVKRYTFYCTLTCIGESGFSFFLCVDKSTEWRHVDTKYNGKTIKSGILYIFNLSIHRSAISTILIIVSEMRVVHNSLFLFFQRKPHFLFNAVCIKSRNHSKE